MDLEPLQLVSLLDQLLACLATYARGDCLAQTVYTSLYMMLPDRRVQRTHALLRPESVASRFPLESTGMPPSPSSRAPAPPCRAFAG